MNERKKFEFVETVHARFTSFVLLVFTLFLPTAQVLSFMLGWLTFYHQGHEIATDFYSVKMELQMRLQRTRNNFNMTQEETKCLRQKMLNNREKVTSTYYKNFFNFLFLSLNKNFKILVRSTRCTLDRVISFLWRKVSFQKFPLFLILILFVEAFSTSWTKHFCQYEKNSHRMSLIQYTQTMGKIASLIIRL